MTPINDPLVIAFERAAIEPGTFGHRDHLYVAWCYLRVLPLEDALARFVRHLRALTSALGVPHKYHATITWGFVVLLHDAMVASPGVTFDALLVAHPLLLEKPPSALCDHFDPAVLESAEARERFLLPRRRPKHR